MTNSVLLLLLLTFIWCERFIVAMDVRLMSIQIPLSPECNDFVFFGAHCPTVKGWWWLASVFKKILEVVLVVLLISTVVFETTNRISIVDLDFEWLDFCGWYERYRRAFHRSTWYFMAHIAIISAPNGKRWEDTTFMICFWRAPKLFEMAVIVGKQMQCWLFLKCDDENCKSESTFTVDSCIGFQDPHILFPPFVGAGVALANSLRVIGRYCASQTRPLLFEQWYEAGYFTKLLRMDAYTYFWHGYFFALLHRTNVLHLLWWQIVLCSPAYASQMLAWSVI